MNKKFTLIFLVVLALLLTACGGPQAASTAVPTPKKNNAQPQASATLGTSFADFATQTAIALTGTPAGLPPIGDGTTTATPGVQPTLDPAAVTPTATPLASVTPGNVQPTVQTAKPATYKLQQGEFIFCLARRFNVDVEQTLALNGLVDSETLHPGLTVKIPAGGSFAGTRALKPHPATYTVRAGDTIYSVACLYGDVEPLNIAAVNGLAAPYKLTAGAQIKIP